MTKDHIMEIFSTYGKIKMIDMPVERMHPHLSKGYAYVEFENPDEAEKALKHRDHCYCSVGTLSSATASVIQSIKEKASATSHMV